MYSVVGTVVEVLQTHMVLHAEALAIGFPLQVSSVIACPSLRRLSSVLSQHRQNLQWTKQQQNKNCSMCT